MKDRYSREIEYMRISLTDRCNLRCRYCMPHDISFIPHDQILSYEEILRICQSALDQGINRFKITGGEPFLRKGVLDFMERLKNLPGTVQVTATSNGVLLKDMARELQRIGINGLNISLDTLDEERFYQLTGSRALPQILEGIDLAYELGLKLKINCVPLKGVNDRELLTLLDFAKDRNIDVRFIEIMPIGYGKGYAGISLNDLEQEIRRSYPHGEDVMRRLGNGPARYYHPQGFQGSIGFIDAIHGKFCDKCNRVRMTSEGFLKTCLYYNKGVSLRDYIRSGGDDQGLRRLMEETIYEKPKEHEFHSKAQESAQDLRKMSQIGG